MNIRKLTAAFIAAAIIPASVFAESITVLLDGSPLDFSVEPFITEGTTFVPMRAIFEALGAQISWDDASKTVTSSKDGTEIKITIGSTDVYRNGEKGTLLAAPVISEDFTMVPLRFVSESFGCSVSWNGETQTVVISTENPLENTTMGFVGDSICYGTNCEGGYAKIISEQNRLTAFNEAKGGSALSRGIPWNEESDAKRPSIIDMLDALPDELDYVIMEGGLNDFWGHAELGETDSADELTYSGALNALFSKAKTDYPNSKLGFVIAHDAFTYDAEERYEAYYQRTKDICDRHGIPYLDLYVLNNKETGVNVKDAEMKKMYFETEERPGGDGVHPNRLGYNEIYVQPMVEWLRGL